MLCHCVLTGTDVMAGWIWGMAGMAAGVLLCRALADEGESSKMPSCLKESLLGVCWLSLRGEAAWTGREPDGCPSCSS